MSWAVVVNPWAGREGEIEARARAALQARHIEHDLYVSSDAAHLGRIVEDAAAGGARRFVSVGGDGTAHLVVNALMARQWEQPPMLAILPAGSGSDFIRTFALPKTLEGAVEHLLGDEVYRCDVGVIEGGFGKRFFLNAANVGVAAAAATVAARLPRRLGGVRYAVGFWVRLATFPAAPVVLTAGSRRYEGTAITVVAANGQFFGGGMNIAPKATVSDGLLDIQVFTGPRRQAFTVQPRVVRGTHLGHPGVHRFSAAEFSLDCPAGWPIEADGEVIGIGPIKGHIVPGAIDFKI